jgi:predicted kinase
MKSLQLNKPHLLVMVGMPGSGKSTFANQFASTFNAPLVDYAGLLHVVGGDLELTYRVADHVIEQLLRTKQSIIIDGPGDKLADRKEIIKLARQHGYTPLFIWVQTEPTTAEYRAVHQKGATLNKAEYTARVEGFEYLTNVEPVLVISGKHTYASQARIVLKKLVTERPSVSDSKVETPPPRNLPTRGRFIR